MSLRRHADVLRSLAPQAARERMYEWHPGRDRRWREYPGVQRVPDGCAVLTFDDGPDEDATPEVLDALDAAGAHATFFLLATQVQTHLDIAHEIVRSGHEVGLHGYEHHRHDRIDRNRSHDDVVKGYEAIEAALGIRTRWYRPPYGKMSQGSLEACHSLGLTPVYWSAWGLDWEDVPAERITCKACDQLDAGGILLLHDSARFARRPSAVPTAKAIPSIAACAKNLGISLVSMGEATVGCEEISV